MDIVRITELQPKTYVEQGDYIAIDNQSDGTKKVQFTNLLDDTLSQENKIAPANVVGDEIANIKDEVEDEIATIKSAVGSPLKASTVAQMTDKNKIYVYVGSETGYTNGNWYYWNGSAWTSGGVYNSVAVVTDPTLTLSGVPADAKATGDEVTNLKSDFTYFENAIVKSFVGLEPYLYKKNTYINSSGVDTSLNGYDTYKIPLDALDYLYLSWSSDFWGALGGQYVFHVEFSDSSRAQPNGITTYAYMALATKDFASFWGDIDGISDVVAVYVTVKSDLVGNVKVSINKPNISLVNDVQSTWILDSSNVITTSLYYKANKSWGALSSPYFINVFKMKAGDTLSIGRVVSGVSYHADVIYADGTTGTIDIYTFEFTPAKDCVVFLFDNSTLSGQNVLHPADSIKVSINDIVGNIEQVSSFNNLNAVAFGTSLTYRALTTQGYLQYLPDLSGMLFDNQGVGSATIMNGILTKIKGYANYSDKDVCLLEGFVNDWYTNEPLGNFDDATETTVCGCVRSAINYIFSQNSNITIFLMLDHYGRNNLGINCSTTATNASGLTQMEYYDEIAKVANSLSIPVIKLYEISQISENTPQYLEDNIHPTTLGAKQTAYAIWSQMKQYYPNQV